MSGLARRSGPVGFPVDTRLVIALRVYGAADALIGPLSFAGLSGEIDSRSRTFGDGA